MAVSLRASDVMERNIVTVDASDSVSKAIKTMVDANVWSLVVQKQGLPIGVVTDRDVLRRCLGKRLVPDAIKVEEIMTSPIITMGPEAHLGELMQKMVEKAIRRIFIVENGKIVGRVTQTMLFENTLNLMMTLSSMRYQM